MAMQAVAGQTRLETDALITGMVGEVGIYVQRDPDTIRAADILFISHERLAQAKPGSFLDVPPELVDEQTLSVYRATTEFQELTETAVPVLNDILPGFRCPVAELFR